MFGLKKKKALMEPFIKEYPTSEVTFVKGKWYDCEIKHNGKLYLCRFYRLPNNCQMTVNNRYIWQILNGRPGIKTMPGVEKFIDGKDSRAHIKVALIVNNKAQIRRWINECEMEFVDSYMDIYGAKMCDIEKLVNQISAL